MNVNYLASLAQGALLLRVVNGYPESSQKAIRSKHSCTGVWNSYH